MEFLDKAREFGENFLGALNEKAGTGENTPRSLDIVDPNDPNRVLAPYGSLGSFASKIDKTAQRSYVESGYIRNVKPNKFEFLMQEPDLTVVIKKRMFSSLIDNYKVDKMDSGDRNLLKASKRLFQNKCQVISIYEKLTKVERIIESRGAIDDYLTPILVTGVQALSNLGVNIVSTKTKDVLDQVRKLQAYSEPEQFTKWIVDPDAPFDFGEGTGVFELTLVSNINTTTSTELGGGSCNLTIENPYGMLNITEQDVEKAINDVYNPKKNSQLFQFSESELIKQNNRLVTEFASFRRRRGASQITIKVSDASILYKRVRAIVDEIGKEIIFDYNAGVLGVGSSVSFDEPANEALGIHALNNTEKRLFRTILNNTYTLLNLQRQKEREIDPTVIDESNDEKNYVREKMRLQFQNKNIIQVMDSIHVYISSKTTLDNQISGLDNSSLTSPGSNLLTKLNSSISNFEQTFNNFKGMFGGNNPASSVEIEKAAIVGPDFPTWLWVTMRNDFTKQAAGTHVFAGLVESATEKYQDGKFTLEVNVKDNSSYFNKGITNVKPSTDVGDREIYDPLTPFKLDFDASSGFLLGETPELLYENEQLLATGDIKFKNGSRFLGSVMSKFLYNINDFSKQNSNSSSSMQKIFYDPDGFVYRWKSGIGTYTYSGPKHPKSYLREQTSPSLTKNVFAGQDVMNVLSLLVTGTPYNYNKFITSAIDAGNLALNDKNPSGQNSVDNVDIAVTFFRNYISDLQINNLTWGNFIPFKKLIVSEQGLNFLISGQFSIQKNNAELGRLLSQRAKKFDSLTVISGDFASNPDIFGKNSNGDFLPQISDSNQNLSSNKDVLAGLDQIKELDTKINNHRQMINDSITQANLGTGELKIFGDDISFDPAYSEDGAYSNEEDRERSRLELRKKMNMYTQRRLWRVKSNEDMNLFIVDDQYDKDYDIQAFEKELAGKLQLLKSEYSDVFDRINQVAKILGLEIFADTQGHIRVQPPGYNKVPSSVFYRLITDRKRLFPKQLENLFLNQAEGLIDRLEIIEDEIRLRTTALGFSSDIEASKFLSGSRVQRSGYTFKFVTLEDGNFGGKPYTVRALVMQDSPDVQEDKEKRSLAANDFNNSVNSVNGQVRASMLFDTDSQIQTVYNQERFKKIGNNEQTRYETIRDRLRYKKNQNVPTERGLFSDVRGALSFRTQSDVLKVTKEISQFVSERQSLLKTLNNAIKNINQGLALNNPNDNKGKKAALFPSLYRKTNIPSVLEHMIEDEEIDDLGPGSGGRYIIKENQIISMSIGEKPPQFTSVEVNGLFGPGYVQPSTDFEYGSSLPGGGGSANAIVSAIAVDYDLWRMYGFKVSPSISAKFIENPEGQAAPLANWYLTEQRRKIISGNISIVGNEYMQPGETVYIESKDLLFYVESVSHSFGFGSNFTTSLTLTYGHNPGEYFPTMLDIVGKGLYSKRHNSNLVKHIRHGNSQGHEHLGVLVVDGNSEIDPLNKLIRGKYGDKNRKVLTNMLIALKSSETQDVEPKVEIRVYKNSSKNSPPTTLTTESLEQVGEQVKVWLKDPTKRSFGPGSSNNSQSGQPLIQRLGQAFKGSNQPDPMNEGMKFESVDQVVNVVVIDTDDPRSPSGQAWTYARESLTGARTGNISPEQVALNARGSRGTEDVTKRNSFLNVFPAQKALHSSILDIWIKFVPKTKSLETSKLESFPSQKNMEDQIALKQAEFERDS